MDKGVAADAARAASLRPQPASQSSRSGIANAGHTPGPWRWEVNRKHKTVHLCGGPPKHGFGRYDLTVLSFRRYGMTGASPVFWNWNMERWVGRPERADALAVEVEGREHHSDWFADINHPDARLIAAAPELLEALGETWRVLRAAGLLNLTNGVQLGQTSWYVKICDAGRLSDAAIAKATATHSTGGA